MFFWMYGAFCYGIITSYLVANADRKNITLKQLIYLLFFGVIIVPAYIAVHLIVFLGMITAFVVTKFSKDEHKEMDE